MPLHESGSTSRLSDSDAGNLRGSKEEGGARSGGAGALAATGSLLNTAAVSPNGPREAADESAPSSTGSSRAMEGPGSQLMHQTGGSVAGGTCTGGNGECVQGGGMPAGFLAVQILWEVRSVALICIYYFFSSHPRGSAVLDRLSSAAN